MIVIPFIEQIDIIAVYSRCAVSMIVIGHQYITKLDAKVTRIVSENVSRGTVRAANSNDCGLYTRPTQTEITAY
jgi:LEA14-like dessication related protein